MKCIFCKIISKEIPSYKVYEDDVCYAFLDINPTGVGETLVIPKEHYEDFNTLDTNIREHIFNVTEDIANTLINKLNADGYTLVINYGFVQEVKHFHIHIVPKYKEKINLSLNEAFNVINN